jgi:hypothetical protein
MDEETTRKMAIEHYLQGKEPISIYHASPHETSPPLQLNPDPPEAPLKWPSNKHKTFCAISLDTQLPFLYIQPTPKRVLINHQK